MARLWPLSYVEGGLVYSFDKHLDFQAIFVLLVASILKCL